MRDIEIKEIKTGIMNYIFGCGPIDDFPVVSIKYVSGKSEKWLNYVQITDILVFTKTDQDIFDDIVNMNCDEKFINLYRNSKIQKFGGINLHNFKNVFDSMEKSGDTPATKMLRLVFYLAENINQTQYIQSIKTAKISQLEIKISKIEKKYAKTKYQNK